MAIDDECDRQLILLALAVLSLQRPGWAWTLGNIAEKLQGREMFETFRACNEDAVRQMDAAFTMDPRHA